MSLQKLLMGLCGSDAYEESMCLLWKTWSDFSGMSVRPVVEAKLSGPSICSRMTYGYWFVFQLHHFPSGSLLLSWKEVEDSPKSWDRALVWETQKKRVHGKYAEQPGG